MTCTLRNPSCKSITRDESNRLCHSHRIGFEMISSFLVFLQTASQPHKPVMRLDALFPQTYHSFVSSLHATELTPELINVILWENGIGSEETGNEMVIIIKLKLTKPIHLSFSI